MTQRRGMTTGRCGHNMQQSGDSIDLRGLTWVPPCCAGHQSCRPWMRCWPAHSGRACCCCPPCCPDCPLMEHFPCLQHSRINAHLPSTWHLPFANSLAVQVCTVLVCVAARRSLILISMCTSCAWLKHCNPSLGADLATTASYNWLANFPGPPSAAGQLQETDPVELKKNASCDNTAAH